ncbi:MAG: hypothetical protein LBL74_03720 [Bacteroidales bacterium]|jgi:hypothetical protein|nr:hypothetical protein [Bacteroidales bacterium]
MFGSKAYKAGLYRRKNFRLHTLTSAKARINACRSCIILAMASIVSAARTLGKIKQPFRKMKSSLSKIFLDFIKMKQRFIFTKANIIIIRL